MRPRLLYLAKFLAVSLLLNAAWHPFSGAYVASLNLSIGTLNRIPDFISGEDALRLGEMSKLLIPLVSIMIVTPGLGPVKKATFVAAGIAAFWAADFIGYESLVYMVLSHGMTEGSALLLAANAIPWTIKWLLPFIFGIMPNYPYLRDTFSPHK